MLIMMTLHRLAEEPLSCGAFSWGSRRSARRLCSAERLRLKAGPRPENGATHGAAIGHATPRDAPHVSDVDHEVPVRLGEELFALRSSLWHVGSADMLQEVAARNGPRGVMRHPP